MSERIGSPAPEPSSWWIVLTGLRCEHRVTQGLQDRGFEAYCPQRVMEFRVGRQRRPACRLVPGLPGYLFARPAAAGLTWHEMIGVDGLKGVLANEWKPVRPSASEMDRMMATFSLKPPPIIEDAYKIGDKVRVTLSQSADFDAIVAGKAKSGRFTVLSVMFGREVQIEVDQRQLVAA